MVEHKKYRVGILGATGVVGQQFVSLLQNHPWFTPTFLAASKESPTYRDALREKGWFLPEDLPEGVASLKVHEARNLGAARDLCDLVFSALDTETARDLERVYTTELPVVSCASAHRWDSRVPMLIPEVNPDHLQIIPAQKEIYKLKGFLVVKPNCSVQTYLVLLRPLLDAGYLPNRIVMTTLQAASGAGRPGVSAVDLTDNWLPHISGEEEKTEQEPLKILGSIVDGKLQSYTGLTISATCSRVNVSDGHGAFLSIGFADKKPSVEQMIDLWEKFRAQPQTLDLPSAPQRPIIYRSEENRPQPKLDRDAENGMAVTVGRLREDSVLDYKFISLSHNTKRGAAGGAILTAELLAAKGYLG